MSEAREPFIAISRDRRARAVRETALLLQNRWRFRRGAGGEPRAPSQSQQRTRGIRAVSSITGITFYDKHARQGLYDNVLHASGTSNDCWTIFGCAAKDGI